MTIEMILPPAPDSNTIVIPLTQGKAALIDAEDYERVSQHRWHANYDKRDGRWTARTKIPSGYRFSSSGNIITGQTVLLLHVLIMEQKYIDHVNGNPLDCRKSNLRSATDHQNMANTNRLKTNTSGYKGVSWVKSRQKWYVYIQVHGIRMHIGYYDDPKDAARAYDTAAVECFGAFARTNEMLGLLN